MMMKSIWGSVSKFKLRSIQSIITVSFIGITIVVILIVSALLYSKFAKTAEQNAYLNTQQIVDQVNYNLENYVKGMAEIFELSDNVISQNPALSDNATLEQLQTILHTREDLVSLALFTNTGDLVKSIPNIPLRKNTRLTEQSWFAGPLKVQNHLTFSAPHVQNLFKGQYKWVVSMSRSITLNKGNKKVEGVLLVDVNFKAIDELSRRVSLGKKGYVYIVDEAGNIIYHPQQQLIYIGLMYENVEQALKYAYGSYKDTSNGEQRLITIKTVSNVGWKIVGVSYMDEIVTTKKELSGFLIKLLLFVIVFVLVISIVVSAKIAYPIRSLERSVRMVEKGDFDTTVQVSGTFEIKQLSRRFNLMLSRIRQLMEQNIAEQEAKRKSELAVLQAQINPHFLYNTLNSVIRMVGSGKKEDVVTMISSLSKFFRISLSKGNHVITVQEELEHIRNYLVIQNIRYKNKFTYEITAQEEVLQCTTLKLILQPLVENAIYHGIECMPDEGLIQISASLVDHKVLLQVKDNGLGMGPELLNQVHLGLIKSENGSGVGVKNVYERIRLAYGKEYGLVYESQLEEGTTVNVWIPYNIEEEEGGAI